MYVYNYAESNHLPLPKNIDNKMKKPLSQGPLSINFQKIKNNTDLNEKHKHNLHV